MVAALECKADTVACKRKRGPWVQALLLSTLPVVEDGRKKKVAGWVARTRPLAEPLSPRGPQPVPQRLRTSIARNNGSPEPPDGVPR
jgi:hypothetical protein